MTEKNPEQYEVSVNPQATAGAQPPTSEPGHIRSLMRDLSMALPTSGLILLVIYLFFYRPVRVEGTSMLPILEDQDRLVINTFAGEHSEIHRGDIVVFRYPLNITKSYIKRVIALPGDTLRVDHGTVYVNDLELHEPYVPVKFQDDRSQPEMTVPKGEYFMMGDHRSISSDSRDFGPVKRDLIYGRASFVFWPMDQAGVVR